MDRRDFLKHGSMAAGLAATHGPRKAEAAADVPPIPRRRLGKTGVDLSILAFGGIVVTDTDPAFAREAVAEAVDRGINYFDVAPSYGNAQERLGPALEPYRGRSFLACKTGERTSDGARKQLEESLRQLKTDHLDLYQLHAMTKMAEVEQVFGPGGAMETFVAARQEGKVRFLGFSAHSVEAALALMDRFAFDTILFPINFVLFSQAGFGPQVLAKAREKGMGILALKAMAKTVWPQGQDKHPQPKCWYQPAALPDEASLGLRWTLSQPITAAVPPGDAAYFRVAMDVAGRFEPLKPEEEQALLARAKGVEPIFRLGHA